MACKRCESDPQPSNSGSARRCAFSESGEFQNENWNCATITALLEDASEHSGHDETLEVVSVPGEPDEEQFAPYYTDGWIILTRYKHRGETSGAFHVRWNGGIEPLTLKLAERVIEARKEISPT